MNFYEEVEKVRTMLNDGMPEGPPRVLVNDIEQRINGLLRAVDLDDLRDQLITALKGRAGRYDD